jgi:hypothetical protein
MSGAELRFLAHTRGAERLADLTHRLGLMAHHRHQFLRCELRRQGQHVSYERAAG